MRRLIVVAVFGVGALLTAPGAEGWDCQETPTAPDCQGQAPPAHRPQFQFHKPQFQFHKPQFQFHKPQFQFHKPQLHKPPVHQLPVTKPPPQRPPIRKPPVQQLPTHTPPTQLTPPSQRGSPVQPRGESNQPSTGNKGTAEVKGQELGGSKPTPRLRQVEALQQSAGETTAASGETAGSKPLPFTGSDLWLWVVASVALLGSGALLRSLLQRTGSGEVKGQK